MISFRLKFLLFAIFSLPLIIFSIAHHNLQGEFSGSYISPWYIAYFSLVVGLIFGCVTLLGSSIQLFVVNIVLVAAAPLIQMNFEAHDIVELFLGTLPSSDGGPLSNFGLLLPKFFWLLLNVIVAPWVVLACCSLAASRKTDRKAIKYAVATCSIAVIFLSLLVGAVFLPEPATFNIVASLYFLSFLAILFSFFGGEINSRLGLF